MTDSTPNTPRFTTWRGIIQATDAARSAPDRAAKIIDGASQPDDEEEDEDRARTAARAVMTNPSKSKSAMTKAGRALTQRRT